MDLTQFTGTEQWYRHWANPHITFTDGVKYVADEGAAYWLLDEIALAQRYQYQKAVAREAFQVWKLKRNATGHGAKLTCEDGNNNVVFIKRIPFTDFPLPEITLWFTDNVILLPSEY